MKTLKEYYYTYYSYEEWGRGYIGSRGCKCLPEDDVKYFGSFTDKTFKPTQKIILRSDYASREEAYADEITLQKFYKIIENSHFANRSCQTSTGFSREGYRYTESEKKILSEKLKGLNCGENNPMYGKRGSDNPMYGRRRLDNPHYGKKRSEETKRKISESNLGKKKSEEHIKKIKETKNKNKEYYAEIARRAAQKRKGVPLTEEHKNKLKESCKNKNIGQLNGNYGKTWFTDGIHNVMAFKCPEGFYRGYVNKANTKIWKIEFENGECVIAYDLRRWCKNNGYNVSNLTNVWRKRIKKHKNIISVSHYEK